MDDYNARPATSMRGRCESPPICRIHFLFRLAFTSVMLLWLAPASSDVVVAHLLPPFRAEVLTLDDNISIISLDLSRESSSSTIRLRANLRRPIYINRSVVYPRGWLPNTEGGYQVNFNTYGVLQSPLILLIVVLSWPHRSVSELVVRFGLALFFLAVLIGIDAPFELVGNFQHEVLLDVDPQGFHGIFIWDRFLEGGGNCALALAMAALAIVLPVRSTRSSSAQRRSDRTPGASTCAVVDAQTNPSSEHPSNQGPLQP